MARCGVPRRRNSALTSYFYMNLISADYRQELFLRSALVAFLRDRLPKRVQLHWYFEGKSEVMLSVRTPALHSIAGELGSLAGSLPTLKRRDDWKRANRAQGMFDALVEMLALAEIAISNGTRVGRARVELLQEVHDAGVPELRREIAKDQIRAIECAGVFNETHPLRGYFEAKERALREARTMDKNRLSEKWVQVREEAIEAMDDIHMCYARLGAAAGYGDGAAFAWSVKRAASAKRA